MAPTALVIDDNSVVRQILRLELERRGWKVAEASNAYEGLVTFRELGPQLVTLDLLMPINDGVDSVHLARMIREEDPASILFVVSSFADRNDLQVFFSNQQVELFAKSSADGPIFDELFERVDQLFPPARGPAQVSRSEQA
jgi:two-component system, chemotaxis family, chemotaxis protein CheY